MLLTAQEITGFAFSSPLRKHEYELSGILADPASDFDKGANKIRQMFARYLRDLWNKRDPDIRALALRETYPDGEPFTWLSILSCYGAFKPDFAYYEAQRPRDSFVLLRKRSERLTSQAEWFGTKAPVVVHQSEVAHVVGCDAYVVMTLKCGDRIVLNHHSIAVNPDDDFMRQYTAEGAASLD